jgi:hypothetical protein
MKTTRTLRIALLALVATNLATYVLLHTSVPMAELFEYATGMVVAAGLCAFLVAEPAAHRPLQPSTKAPGKPIAHRTRPAARTLAHAM